jgi:hypothetical protein
MENQINGVLAGQLSVLEDEELEKELELIMRDVEIPNIPIISQNIPITSEKIPIISEKIIILSEKTPKILEKIPIISENEPNISEIIENISIKDSDNKATDQNMNEISADKFPEVPTSPILPIPPSKEILTKEKVIKEKRNLISS